MLMPCCMKAAKQNQIVFMMVKSLVSFFSPKLVSTFHS